MLEVRQYIDSDKLRDSSLSTNGRWSPSLMLQLAALVCFIWYLVVLFIANYGVVEIFLKFNSVKKIPYLVDPERLDPGLTKQSDVSTTSTNAGARPDDDTKFEGVTILRPLKGIDPEVEACLESSVLQYYPIDKFEVLFCVEDPCDPVIPVVQHLMSKYPKYNLKLLIGDPENPDYYGPNPKINNLGKGFVAAKYDIVWVMDSNVWCSSGTLLRSVHALNNSLDNGRKTISAKSKHGMKVKIVHHVPLAITLNNGTKWSNFGCKLDEVFLKTSHAKFYVSFNKLAVAPCINGKSNMYRISDIDSAVSRIAENRTSSNSNLRDRRFNIDGPSSDLAQDAAFYTSGVNCRGHGIRYFSKFIGEDNMIGIALWETGGRSGLTGDSVIQPLGATNGIKEYILRRSRWLRVRKHMVLMATLLEPTTESILAGIYGTFGISVLLLKCKFSYWYFLFHFLVWFTIDYLQFHVLLRFAASDDGIVNSYNASKNHEKPYFTDPNYNIVSNNAGRIKDSAGNIILMKNKDFKEYLMMWILRELLAFPIWAYAMVGTTIDWRGRPFKINSDLTATNL